MRCEVADDSVVVKKSRPEKAGNRLEDKTGMTRRLVGGGRGAPKAAASCEGMTFIRRFLKAVRDGIPGHKPPDGAGHFTTVRA
jgi:hypothetical protein